MAVCMGASTWRVLRRLHLAGGSLPYAQARPMGKRDPELFAGLERAGFVRLSDDARTVSLTDRGRQVQELGEVTIAELDLLWGRGAKVKS